MDHCVGKTENFHSHQFMYRKNDYLRKDMTARNLTSGIHICHSTSKSNSNQWKDF